MRPDVPVGHQIVIGLEIHAQLSTLTKVFCGCPVDPTARPNTLTCPVCLGLPGALPVLNRSAVHKTLLLALALGCTVQRRSSFSRKSYIYPDLPKGFQITQHEEPIATGGRLPFQCSDGVWRSVDLERLHLEEDAARSIHQPGLGRTLIDLNRSGVALAEVVTRPRLAHPEHAAAALRQVRSLLRWLSVSDGNMEHGSLRCDANISVSTTTGEAERHHDSPRVEIKNLNSFRHVERALTYEAQRQTRLLREGGRLASETRTWDERREQTLLLRSKEQAPDYRFHRETDLGDLLLQESDIRRAEQELPELPWECQGRLQERLGLPFAQATVLARDREIADYLDATLRASGADPRLASGLVLSEILRLRKIHGAIPVEPSRLAELLVHLEDGRIGRSAVGQVIEAMAASSRSAAELIAELGLEAISEAGDLEAVAAQVLERDQRLVRRYRAGEQRLLKHFLGEVMRATRGRAEPGAARRELLRQLEQGS